MNTFKILPTSIENAFLIEPTVYDDSRGYFMETYNARAFVEAGIQSTFLQDNHAHSTRGVLRGLHFQKKRPQGKLVRVIGGEVFDVAVDLRQGSATFGKWFGAVLSQKNKKQFYIPRGLAHGFLVLSEEAELIYKCDAFYCPEDEGGILWNDPALCIQWPITSDMEIKLNEKDRQNPPFGGFCFD